VNEILQREEMEDEEKQQGAGKNGEKSEKEEKEEGLTLFTSFCLHLKSNVDRRLVSFGVSHCFAVLPTSSTGA
jgi:hypothetical protein